MLFQCFVCEKSFSKTHHRTSHICLKQDSAHRLYLQNQQQNLLHQFSITVEAATTAAANDLSPYSSVVPHALVQENDVDQDDLPTSCDMDIDPSPEDSDGEQSIISGPEMPVTEGEDDGPKVLAETMDAASRLLGGIDLDDLLQETFDFLPDPDLDFEQGEAGSGSSTTASQQRTRHTLVDLAAEHINGILLQAKFMDRSQWCMLAGKPCSTQALTPKHINHLTAVWTGKWHSGQLKRRYPRSPLIAS